MQFQFRDFYDYPRNAQLPLFKQDNEEFGDPAGHVVILLEAPDVFDPIVLAHIDKVTRALEPDPTFVRVRSLTNARGIYARNDDIATGTLYRELPPSPEDNKAIRDYVTKSPLYVRRLVSADGRYTAILAEMRTPATFASIGEQSHAVEVVSQTLAKMPPPSGVRATVSGAPLIETETTHSLVSDQMTLIPGVMTVIVLALIWTFRSAHGVLLSLAAVNVALIWMFGVYSLFGRPIDILASVTPTALLVYGVVDPIFVLTRFLQKLEIGRSKDDAIVQAFDELAMPCFLTSVTTAVGFGTFAFAVAPTVRFYGITIGTGVLLAWVTTVTVLPLLLSVAPLPKRRYSALTSTRGVEALVESMWKRLNAHPQAIAIAGVLLLVGGVALGSKQHLSNGYVSGLPRGPAREAIHLLEEKLSGVIRLIVYLEGEPDVMKRPAVLKAIKQVDDAMAKEPGVTSSISLAEEVADVHQAFSGGAPVSRGIPDSESLVSQYLALIDPEDKSDLVSADYSKGHIAFLVADPGSEGARALVARLDGMVKAAGFSSLGVRASLTGNGVVSYSEMDGVVLDILRGFVTAFLLILVFQAIAYRSLRAALLTILPNLLPIVACFVALHLFRVPLRLDTSLVLCVSIGGLFNTTIHIMARLRQMDTTAQRSRSEVLYEALRTVGPPSMYTAGILSAGFAVLGLSRFPGFQAMGFLAMLTLTLGFVCDMVFTSVLAKLWFPWRLSRESEAPAPMPVQVEGVSS